MQTTYPGVNPPNSTINMINQFLNWAQEQGMYLSHKMSALHLLTRIVASTQPSKSGW
jgi:hypothetical protein